MEKFAQIMSVLNIDANSLLRDEMAGECAQAERPSSEAMRLAEQFDRLDGHGKHMLRIVLEAERERMEKE